MGAPREGPMKAGWMAALAAAAACCAGAAAAQTQGFVELGVVEGDSIVFVDTASVSMRGSASEADYVIVGPAGEDTIYENRRIGVDCQTRAVRFLRGRSFATVGGVGAPLTGEELETADEQASDDLMALVCGVGDFSGPAE